MEQFDTAPCGCPRYDMKPGIAKVHDKNCADAVKPKPAVKVKK